MKQMAHPLGIKIHRTPNAYTDSKGNSYDLIDMSKQTLQPFFDKILFVGTIISDKNNGFYYTSANNQFYKLLDAVLGITGKGFEELKKQLRKDLVSSLQGEIIKIEDLLKNYPIGFCDVYKSCYIKKGSSLDKDILKEQPSGYPQYYTNEIVDNINKGVVKKLFFTSEKAFEIFTKTIKKLKITKENENDILDRCTVLISPSASNSTDIEIKKYLWKVQIGDCIDRYK